MTPQKLWTFSLLPSEDAFEGWEKEGGPGGKPHEARPSQKGVLAPPSSATFPTPSGVVVLFLLFTNPELSRPEALLEGSRNLKGAFSGTFVLTPYDLHTPMTWPKAKIPEGSNPAKCGDWKCSAACLRYNQRLQNSVVERCRKSLDVVQNRAKSTNFPKKWGRMVQGRSLGLNTLKTWSVERKREGSAVAMLIPCSNSPFLSTVEYFWVMT